MSAKKQTNTDKFSQYLEFRTEYFEELREHDLVDSRNRVRPELVDSLYGSDTMIPVEGSPLDEHCREHPDDPLCWVVNTGDVVEQFLDIRSKFLERIAKHDLHDVQRFVFDMTAGGTASVAGNVGNVGLITPDQDLDDIPPWLRPYVTPGRMFADGQPQPLPFDRSNFGSALLY